MVTFLGGRGGPKGRRRGLGRLGGEIKLPLMIFVTLETKILKDLRFLAPMVTFLGGLEGRAQGRGAGERGGRREREEEEEFPYPAVATKLRKTSPLRCNNDR